MLEFLAYVLFLEGASRCFVCLHYEERGRPIRPISQWLSADNVA